MVENMSGPLPMWSDRSLFPVPQYASVTGWYNLWG